MNDSFIHSLARIMLFIIQKMFLITVPISTLLTTLAMLLPYWWSSDTFQVGLWRARLSSSSSWLLVEPQIETEDGKIEKKIWFTKKDKIHFLSGRLLFILQLLSFVSIILSDISGILWLIILLRRQSLPSHFGLLIFTILSYLCLSTMIYFVWQTTKDYIHLIHLSHSFYLVLSIILLHSLTLISMTMNLLQYRTNHHSIQPCSSNEKVLLAFNELIVWKRKHECHCVCMCVFIDPVFMCGNKIWWTSHDLFHAVRIKKDERIKIKSSDWFLTMTRFSFTSFDHCLDEQFDHHETSTTSSEHQKHWNWFNEHNDD